MEKNPKTCTIPLRISIQERASLEWIASHYGDIPLNDVIRKAIATERFLIEQKKKGAAFLMRSREVGSKKLFCGRMQLRANMIRREQSAAKFFRGGSELQIVKRFV